jgi:hypothetical protein
MQNRNKLLIKLSIFLIHVLKEQLEDILFISFVIANLVEIRIPKKFSVANLVEIRIPKKFTGFHICNQKTIDNCTWNQSLKFIEVRIFCYLMPVIGKNMISWFHFFNSCFEGTIRGHTFYFVRNC